MKHASKVLLLTAVAALIVVGCGAGGARSKTKWTEYKSSRGDYTVMLPGSDVEESSETTPTMVGPIKIHMSMVTLDEAAYIVSFNEMDFLEDIELTAQDEDDILTDGVDGALESFQDGDFVYVKDISIGGYPGKEYKARGKAQGMDMVVMGRAYLVGTRLYQLLVTATEKGMVRDDVEKFFDSFELD